MHMYCIVHLVPNFKICKISTKVIRLVLEAELMGGRRNNLFMLKMLKDAIRVYVYTHVLGTPFANYVEIFIRLFCIVVFNLKLR